MGPLIHLKLMNQVDLGHVQLHNATVVEQSYNLCAKCEGLYLVALLFIRMFGGNTNYANRPGVSAQGMLVFKQHRSSVKTLKCTYL